MNILKKLNLKRCMALITALVFCLNFILYLKKNFNSVGAMSVALFHILAVTFCVLCIAEPVKFNNKASSVIILILGIMEIVLMFSLLRDYIGNYYGPPKFLFLRLCLLRLPFYICAFVCMKCRCINILTITLGIYNSVSSMPNLLSEELPLLAAGLFLLTVLIISLIYDSAVKYDESVLLSSPDNVTQLKDLRELLDCEYITREDYDVIKGNIINVSKLQEALNNELDLGNNSENIN